MGEKRGRGRTSVGRKTKVKKRKEERKEKSYYKFIGCKSIGGEKGGRKQEGDKR